MFTLAARFDATAQSVRGRVLDAEGGAPVAGARVTLLELNGRKVGETLTNATGVFSIAARDAGQHRLQASLIGYTTVTTDPFQIASKEQVVVDINVTTRAIALDPLTIVARRPDPRLEATEEGMYARRLALPPIGLRRIWLPHDAELAAARDVADILRQNVPQTARRRCNVVYWNGSLVVSEEQANGLLQSTVSELEAVEYYRSPEDAPPAFRDKPYYLQWTDASSGVRGNNQFENVTCGVLALWPRTGRYLAEEPLPPLPTTVHNWRLAVAPFAYHVSGAFAPGAGAGLELSVQYQKYSTLLLGMNVRASRHTLSADSSARITRTLSALSYQLPAGDRPYLLFSVALEPRVVGYETDRLGLEAGLQLQGWQRQFSLVKNDAGGSEEKELSRGWGAGARLALDFAMSERLSVTAGVNADRVSFGKFQWIERTSTQTAATWWGVGFSLGATWSIAH